jgi:Tfp pilus assembly protein FimT
MVELAIVLVIFGTIIAFGVPMMTGYRSSHMVKIAKENIAGQLRLAREKAISTGATQTLRFIAGFQGADYHVWNGAVANPKWSLPTGIQYLWSGGTQNTFRLTPGRAQPRFGNDHRSRLARRARHRERAAPGLILAD